MKNSKREDVVCFVDIIISILFISVVTFLFIGLCRGIVNTPPAHHYKYVINQVWGHSYLVDEYKKEGDCISFDNPDYDVKMVCGNYEIQNN